MFGIGGSEVIFIIFIVLMLFGADKIPEIARGLGKGMRQLRDATEDIKSEITKTADTNEFTKTISDIKKDIDSEIDQAKQNMGGDTAQQITKIKTDIEDITSGPIKRQN